MKNKPLDIVLLVFKILVPLLMIVPFVFFTYLSIANRVDYLETIKIYGEPPGHYGMAELLYAIIFFFISAVTFVVTLLCLLTAHLFKTSEKREKHKEYFSMMLVAPVAASVFYYIALVLILNIG